MLETLGWLVKSYVYSNIAFQKLLGDVLNSYVYALIQETELGGEGPLSAEAAQDKANSAIDEIITIAKQVKYVMVLLRSGKIYYLQSNYPC